MTGKDVEQLPAQSSGVLGSEPDDDLVKGRVPRRVAAGSTRASQGRAAFAADRDAVRIPRNPTPARSHRPDLGPGRLPGSCRPHPRDSAGQRQTRALLNHAQGHRS
ncbi:hypothetical protein [Phyllobacterium bourgognense]|uniref:hypothetical protein n=1 Tax=Phyllobacterium bourgognense TaxID=314236 RepID=UPI0011C05F28|nr:hypothetical protein [Phyllobacterium bourgognense]